MAIQFDSEEIEDASAEPRSAAVKLPFSGAGKRASDSDRMFFTEQLALLLETGESLYGALTTIAKQTENAQMRGIVEQIAQDISEGHSLAAALGKHETIFSTTYVNLIAASESGGFMHEVLAQLLHMEEKRQQLRDTLVSAATLSLIHISEPTRLQ